MRAYRLSWELRRRLTANLLLTLATRRQAGHVRQPQDRLDNLALFSSSLPFSLPQKAQFFSLDGLRYWTSVVLRGYLRAAATHIHYLPPATTEPSCLRRDGNLHRPHLSARAARLFTASIFRLELVF